MLLQPRAAAGRRSHFATSLNSPCPPDRCAKEAARGGNSQADCRFCGPTWIRTKDDPVMSRGLSPLSYGPVQKAPGNFQSGAARYRQRAVERADRPAILCDGGDLCKRQPRRAVFGPCETLGRAVTCRAWQEWGVAIKLWLKSDKCLLVRRQRGGIERGGKWAKSGRRDLNPRQPAWKAGALPLSYTRKVGVRGLEPPTPASQTLCATNCATPRSGAIIAGLA